MDWMKLPLNAYDSREVWDLSDELAISPGDSFRLLTKLKSWLAVNCQDGRIMSLRPRTLCAACGWPGEPGRLIEAMHAANLVDYQGILAGWESGIGADIVKATEKRERNRLSQQRSRANRKAREQAAATPQSEQLTIIDPEPMSSVCHRPVIDDTPMTSSHKRREEETREDVIPVPTDILPQTIAAAAATRAGARDGGGGFSIDSHGPNLDAAQPEPPKRAKDVEPATVMALKRAASAIGLRTKPADVKFLGGLLAQYGEAGVLAALDACQRSGKCSWGYVSGTLKSMTDQGELSNGVYTPHGKPKPQLPLGKRVAEQNYTQREYRDEDMYKLAVDWSNEPPPSLAAG